MRNQPEIIQKKAFWKNYPFYIFAFLALIIPDIQIKQLVISNVYNEGFAAALSTLFSLLWICAIFFTCRLLPKNAGRIVYTAVGGVFIVFSFAQYIYFQIFDQFFRLQSIGLAGEGGSYFSYAVSHLDIWSFVCTLSAAGCLVATFVKWRSTQKTGIFAKLIILLPVAGLVLTHILLQPQVSEEKELSWDSWGDPRVIYQKFSDPNKSMDIAGIYQFAARDFYKTYMAEGEYSESDFGKVTEYFEEKTALENEYTGLFEGKNVFAVMLEGIDDWMIDEKYTPVMKYMMDNGINFANHYAPTFGVGYTLSSEFCFNSGFYTPEGSASVVYYSSNQYPYALPQLFAEKGYSVNSFHYNHQEFYNRVILHKSLGYEKYHSFQDYGLSERQAESDSVILENDELYHDMIKAQPFFNFVITYSGHVPYTYDDAKLTLAKKNHPELIDSVMDTEENNCRLLARDTDDFFRKLLERLNADGLLEDTVIVVYTDHYAYGYSDKNKLLELSRAAGDDIMYRVPAFIYSADAEPLAVTKPTQTADLMPTLINLFGLDNHGCYIGTDAFDKTDNGFVYFENGSLIDGGIYYDSASEEASTQSEEGIKKFNQCRDINDIVVRGNYFAWLEKNRKEE